MPNDANHLLGVTMPDHHDPDLAQVALTAIFALIDKAHSSGQMAHKRALMEVFGRLCDLTGNSNREAKV